MHEIAIVGGGLCGLALANSLQAQGRSFALYEARFRPGGRILTVDGVDLGPSWFWPDTQPRMAKLVMQLGLTVFRQCDSGAVLNQTDPNARPAALKVAGVHGGAQRIGGGSGAMIDALMQRLPPEALFFDHELVSLRDQGDHIAMGFLGGKTVRTRQAVMALPPRLLAQSVEFSPPLAPQLRQAMTTTATWMAAQAKLTVTCANASWRQQGLSGNAFANYPQAILGEVFDACDETAGVNALGAFVALDPVQRQRFEAGLPLMAASQLAQLFGPGTGDGALHYQDWALERHTCADLDRDVSGDALAHPEYGEPALTQAWWNDKLFLGGTETAVYGGGYMEGALEAAGRIVRLLLRHSARAA